jgi:hypothetical protein
MLNIRPGLSDKEAKEVASLWGENAVHPSGCAYRRIAIKLEEEVESDAQFTNPPKSLPGPSLRSGQT